MFGRCRLFCCSTSLTALSLSLPGSFFLSLSVSLSGTTVQLRLFEIDRCRLIRVELKKAEVEAFLIHSCDMTAADVRWWTIPTPERQRQLVRKLLGRVGICEDCHATWHHHQHAREGPIAMLNAREHFMAMRVQAAYRGKLARTITRKIIRGRFRKDFDPDSAVRRLQST